VRAAVGERDRTVALRHHRAEHIGVERVHQLPQLIPGAAGLIEISTRQHDLEVSRQ
jgi:hypothetical protein